MSQNISMEQAVLSAFSNIRQLQENKSNSHFSRLNITITDGNTLMATRYVSKNQDPLSLYYAVGKSLDTSDDDHLLLEGGRNGTVIIASEPLSDYLEEWHEIPPNNYLVVEKKLKPVVKAFCTGI